jgi:hypothetical protein
MFLSGTAMNGTFWPRACIVNPRTSPKDIEVLVAITKSAGKESDRGL